MVSTGVALIACALWGLINWYVGRILLWKQVMRVLSEEQEKAVKNDAKL